MTDGFTGGVVPWPAGHRAALCVVTLLDMPAPTGSPSAEIGTDYGPTGLNRLLNLFADADVTATVGVSASAVDIAPTLVRQAASSGFELASLTGDETELERTETALTRIAGSSPVGTVLGLPSRPFAGTVPTRSWAVTGSGGDLPQPHGNGWLIPTSPYWVDRAWLDPARPLPPSSLLEAWSLSLSAVRSTGGLMTVVLHAEISGRPGIAGQILRFLDEVIESGDVWIGNAGQVANWWTQQTT